MSKIEVWTDDAFHSYAQAVAAESFRNLLGYAPGGCLRAWLT
jgi:hypothetical protein